MKLMLSVLSKRPAPAGRHREKAASSKATPKTAAGRNGGRLVVALAAEPRTLNPVIAGDLTSRALTLRPTH